VGYYSVVLAWNVEQYWSKARWICATRCLAMPFQAAKASGRNPSKSTVCSFASEGINHEASETGNFCWVLGGFASFPLCHRMTVRTFHLLRATPAFRLRTQIRHFIGVLSKLTTTMDTWHPAECFSASNLTITCCAQKANPTPLCCHGDLVPARTHANFKKMRRAANIVFIDVTTCLASGTPGEEVCVLSAPLSPGRVLLACKLFASCLLAFRSETSHYYGHGHTSKNPPLFQNAVAHNRMDSPYLKTQREG